MHFIDNTSIKIFLIQQLIHTPHYIMAMITVFRQRKGIAVLLIYATLFDFEDFYGVKYRYFVLYYELSHPLTLRT